MKRKRSSNRFLFFGGLLVAYISLVRPRLARWNATDDEVLAPQPGDELVQHPLMQTTQSILVQTPAEKVWPWIAQIGYGRGGFYSYDRLERAAGLAGLRSATTIHPEWLVLKLGDTVSISPVTPMKVEVLQPQRALALHMVMNPFSAQPVDPAAGGPWLDWSWAFLIKPLNDTTCRLVSRVRGVYSPYLPLWPLMALVLEPVSFIMDRKMLLTVKTRAEGQ